MTNYLKLQFEEQLPKPGKTGIDWYLFNQIAQQFENQNMLECGVGNGGSALTLCSLTDKLTVIDNWCQGYNQQSFEQLIKKLNLSIVYLTENTKVAVPKLKNQYAFVHLDANKKYQSLLDDLYQLESKCNGVICVDDYMNSMWPEVTWAVDKFVENSKWCFSLIGNHQIFLSKSRQLLLTPVIDMPLAISQQSIHLTYGFFPSDEKLQQFISAGIMKYSWHDIQVLPPDRIP
jgi:predicted O-methyltransferase YrrM